MSSQSSSYRWKKSISRSCVALAKEQLQRNPMLFMCIYLSFASILYHVYVSMRQREKEKVDVWREKKSIRVVTRNTGFWRMYCEWCRMRLKKSMVNILFIVSVPFFSSNFIRSTDAIRAYFHYALCVCFFAFIVVLNVTRFTYSKFDSFRWE